MEAPTTGQSFSILIINPNTSTHMTDGLKPIVRSLKYGENIHFGYFTAPPVPSLGPQGEEIKGIPSINSSADSLLSAHHCLPHLKPLLPKYDAFLVACYSVHPLVGMLNEQIAIDRGTGREKNHPGDRKKYVTGIFEASVSKSITLLRSSQMPASVSDDEYKSLFGIITTGDGWKEVFRQAVPDLLRRPVDLGFSDEADLDLEPLFAGVETTGLSAVELHTTPADEVQRKMVDATERLIKNAERKVAAICLGCAGMAGMDKAVRQGCRRALGPKDGERVIIVDGVIAGVEILVSACISGH